MSWSMGVKLPDSVDRTALYCKYLPNEELMAEYVSLAYGPFHSPHAEESFDVLVEMFNLNAPRL